MRQLPYQGVTVLPFNNYMNKDLTIGFSGEDIFLIKTMIERLLNKSFEERESSFYGGRYFIITDALMGELTLQENYDQIEEEWIEDADHDLVFILRVSCAQKHDEMKKSLLGLKGSRLIRERSYPL
jgi:hypothetical protein